MLEVFASGLLGAVLVFVLHIWLTSREKAARVRGHWEAIYAEVEECGDIANSYANSTIPSPSGRLPTLCYQTSLPALLTDTGIDEVEAKTLLRFYSAVETVNRGLDYTHNARANHDDMRVETEFRRNKLKASRIQAPSGKLFEPTIAMCMKRKAKPGIAMLESS